jgi:hypothetical protein
VINFRCWFCNRAYTKPDDLARKRFACGCGRRVKVPKRSGGSSKTRSLTDWIVETLIYGGACAVFAFGLSFVIVARLPFFRRDFTPVIVGTLVGLVAGAIFGERAINYIGQKLRDRENE